MIESQLPYFTLIWMFCLKTDMERAEKVQVVYNNYMALHMMTS